MTPNLQNQSLQYPLYYSEINYDLAGDDKYDCMQFRLVYEGELKASSSGNSRVAEKHAIRKHMHLQLAELWRKHPALEFYNTNTYWMNFDERDQKSLREMAWKTDPNPATYKNFLAANFEICKFNFVPLVYSGLNLVCSLDILFLRREDPGNLVQSNKGGGDIDNRIKTLLDALKMPKQCSEVQSTPEAHETPFFCLLEDDALITRLNVTTDRLFTPIKPDGKENDVLLIINVDMRATVTTPINMNLI